MADIMFNLVLVTLCQLLIVAGIFLGLVYLFRFIINKFKASDFYNSSRFFTPQEYLPEEELTTIKQVYYLIMILILVIFVIYSFINWQEDMLYLVVLDLIVSLYLAINMEGSSFKNKCLLFLLIPFGSISSFLFSYGLIFLLDLVHFISYIYFIKQYYHKFIAYTEDNSLGITIMLLFLIVFISFLITIVVEGVSPLDSINMISNAFTSNGYTVLGTSGWGKINAIFLVWSGFILSGVGTATLTVAIVLKHVNQKFDHLEEVVKRNRKK